MAKRKFKFPVEFVTAMKKEYPHDTLLHHNLDNGNISGVESFLKVSSNNFCPLSIFWPSTIVRKFREGKEQEILRAAKKAVMAGEFYEQVLEMAKGLSCEVGRSMSTLCPYDQNEKAGGGG